MTKNIPSAEVENVTDTALWVANYRAEETQRPFPFFKDPLAAVLAGARGKEIAKGMAHSQIMSWIMVVRTAAIDHFIFQCLEDGVDLVLNLGAGLDTRPYRMDLPADLRWVEIDFPSMIHYKNEKLQEVKPICRLERIPLDLSQRVIRQEIFAKIGSEARKVLVITEGVIPYLPNEAVSELAEDLRVVPNFRFWIQDYNQGGSRRRLPREWKKKLKAAPFLFSTLDWFEFFSQRGWARRDSVTSFEAAARIRRPFPFIFPLSLVMRLVFFFVSRKKRESYKNMAGYTLLERA